MDLGKLFGKVGLNGMQQAVFPRRRLLLGAGQQSITKKMQLEDAGWFTSSGPQA